jgi:hypothetical protein
VPSPRGAERLARIAAELEPARPPWWVSHPRPRGATPAQGWYWIPAGGRHPVFLGHNHIVAELALTGLVEAGYVT